MKVKGRRRSSNSSIRRRGKDSDKMKGSLSTHLTAHLGQVVLMPIKSQSSSRFHSVIDSEAENQLPSTSSVNFDSSAIDMDEKDFILSQEFFCTPDYITPDLPPVPIYLNSNKEEEIPCPKSPEKIKSARSKRLKIDGNFASSFSSCVSAQQERAVLGTDNSAAAEYDVEAQKRCESGKTHSYVSQSAVALRCRVMPPPCIRNPCLKDSSALDIDPYDNHRTKFADFYPAVMGTNDGLSRYRTDFHEIEKIGDGNFSCVFKVLKRIDGCLYAVKQSMKQLHNDTERRKALMEVQALAALGCHENVVGYYSSWFENEKLYIQMELCDQSLSINKFSRLFTETEVLQAMHQIAKALHFIHERGIAHLDVKPDNIYVKNGVYKLGDFGCATLLNGSLPIEEGDARYMPQEILNEQYDHLDKVDIFSLGVTMYELVRGSALPESGLQFFNLKEGRLPLLPGHSLQFQNLVKVMVDPDPRRRPSAKALVENPIFHRPQKAAKAK
ncbi:hypothetical protein M9H77_01640 [Catharanthus roseus]|uniref:Uncharacterized protein n=1 Tax=Catharanthus roseus TaxID=4058 RepID=A0ACC0C6M1_CATRO|nr:hypothetical protein M9H77_01640 [Catharanthus roseus]